MTMPAAPSPLTRSQLIDEYFIENRTRLLDLAAYLDRLDRATGAGRDFRMEAFGQALQVLCSEGASRTERIQRILSDPTVEPRPTLDRKSARGAYATSEDPR